MPLQFKSECVIFYFYIKSTYAAASKTDAAYGCQSMATPSVLREQDMGTADLQSASGGCANIYLEFDAFCTVGHAFRNEDWI